MSATPEARLSSSTSAAATESLQRHERIVGALGHGDEGLDCSTHVFDRMGLLDRVASDPAQSGALEAFRLGVSDRDADRQALLAQRDLDNGALLIIYPISRRSRPRTDSGKRRDLFDDPDQGQTVIGLALAFPPSESGATVEYVKGSVAQCDPE